MCAAFLWFGKAMRTNVAKKITPGQFSREVRQEFDKVTWPTRKEATVTTIMVFIMVMMAAIFFLLADIGLEFVVSAILGYGG